MVQVTEQMSAETNYSALYIAVSTSFFFLSNWLIYRLTNPNEIVHKTEYSMWKYRNHGTSLVHALVTGTWALRCLYFEPKLTNDFVNEYTTPAHILINVCIGYFIYDFIDMCINNMGQTTIELLGHHACVIATFLIPVLNYTFIGVTVTGILVEINSIFLHIRHLLHLRGVPRSSPIYRINSYLNVGTFVVFRLGVLTFITMWIQRNKHIMPPAFYWISFISLVVVTVMNYILFYRVVYSDFLKKRVAEELVCSENQMNNHHVTNNKKTKPNFANNYCNNVNNVGKHAD